MEKIEKILDKIRPALQMDGGNVELVSFDEKSGQVKIKLQGACAHCPISDFTLKNLIEQELKNAMPEINSVEAV